MGYYEAAPVESPLALDSVVILSFSEDPLWNSTTELWDNAKERVKFVAAFSAYITSECRGSVTTACATLNPKP